MTNHDINQEALENVLLANSYQFDLDGRMTTDTDWAKKSRRATQQFLTKTRTEFEHLGLDIADDYVPAAAALKEMNDQEFEQFKRVILGRLSIGTGL